MNFRKLLKTRRHLASDSFVPMPQFQKRNIHQDDFSQRTQHRQSCKTQGCRCCIQNEISLIKSKNPNPSPTGKKFGFLCSGGGRWIRTTEAIRSRFTVCPLWPLGNSPIFTFLSSSLYGAGRRTRTPDLLITNQLLYQLSYTGGSNRTRLL